MSITSSIIVGNVFVLGQAKPRPPPPKELHPSWGQFHSQFNYRPRSMIDNTFGSICVCVSVWPPQYAVMGAKVAKWVQTDLWGAKLTCEVQLAN